MHTINRSVSLDAGLQRVCVSMYVFVLMRASLIAQLSILNNRHYDPAARAPSRVVHNIIRVLHQHHVCQFVCLCVCVWRYNINCKLYTQRGTPFEIHLCACVSVCVCLCVCTTLNEPNIALQQALFVNREAVTTVQENRRI